MKEIIIFSDFACPFCYIGFSIAKKLHEEDKNIKFKFYPYILNLNENLEGTPLSNYISKEKSKAAFERIEKLGKEYKLIYNNKNMRFNTNYLHKASLFAQEENKTFEFFDIAFKYIFEYGENVGNNEIVNKIAKESGLNIIKMNSFINSGKYDSYINDFKNFSNQYNITSVPTFIVDGTSKPNTLKPYIEFKKELFN